MTTGVGIDKFSGISFKLRICFNYNFLIKLIIPVLVSSKMTWLSIVKYKVKLVKSPDKTGFKNEIFFGDVMSIWPLNFLPCLYVRFLFLSSNPES